MEKKDKGTIIIVLVILIVCLVTLGFVGSLTWGYVSSPVKSVVNKISDITKVNNLDYNFDIPDVKAGFAIPSLHAESIFGKNDDNAESDTTDVNYNFAFSNNSDTSAVLSEDLADGLLNDAQLIQYVGITAPAGVSGIQIRIPKIGVDSPVWQGLGAADLLTRGFWIYPLSSEAGTGEVVMLCHRRHFAATDPRTCWNLDQVVEGDLIYMTVQDKLLTYKVSKTQIFDAGDPAIYDISENKDRIRISTCHPRYSDAQRFVVFAERVNEE